MQIQDGTTLLRRDVKLLGNMLGEIILSQGGAPLFDIVENIRTTATELRTNYTEATYEALKNDIANISPDMRKQVLRAFSVFFHLVNVAEQNFRIRRRRQYQIEESLAMQPFSIEGAVTALKDGGASSTLIEAALEKLSLELVITAHPTEATKRQVLEIQKRIASILKQLDNPVLTKRESESLHEGLFNEIAILWQTNELHNYKPTVPDEVKSGLYYFDKTLFEVLPDIHRELEINLEKYYPEHEWNVPSFLHFGSWIGGDRDGNPFVTHEVTWQTLHQHRKLTVKKYREVVKDLMNRYSQSTKRITVTPEFLNKIEQDEEKYLTESEIHPDKHEVYCRFFAIVLKRLQYVGTKGIVYPHAEALLDDLHTVQNSLKQHHPAKNELRTIGKFIRQVELFGFHLATLDIRNHSKEHEDAVAEILQKVNLSSDYASLSEADKVLILQSVLEDPRPLLVADEDYSQGTREMIDVFKTIKRARQEFGERAISVYLISMTQAPSDLLEVLVLAKEAGLYRLHADGSVESHLNVAPLLETIDDLTAGPEIMEALFELPVYRGHLKLQGDRQEVMLGYSDGSKDGGNLAANWKLYKAQIEVHEMAKKHGVNIKFFHGRGGSLGRGGGTLNKSILSQPTETVNEGVKITEQGEVLSSRYLLSDIAYRSLEQASSSLLQTVADVLESGENQEYREAVWVHAFENISATSYTKYRALVFENPDFLQYFTDASPINEIGNLNIGSRPMHRKNNTSFEDLRAIPWVFAWMQNRQLLPAWYAAGTGLQSFVDAGHTNLDLLQDMYEKWPFFKSTIDNLQMALMKADIKTAREYVTLVSNKEAAEKIFADILEEFEKTKQVVLQISGASELLEHSPNIKESVHRRNPYVDPLNFLQVQLLKELRESENPDSDLLVQVLLTINGISAGLRNTG